MRTTLIVLGALSSVSLARVVMDLFPETPLTEALKYSLLGCQFVMWVLIVVAGVRRRRPYWTPESWRRFRRAYALPVAALLVFAILEAVFEWKTSWFGASHSPARGAWLAVSVLLMLVGAGGVGIATAGLVIGEPSRQFTGVLWRARATE